METAFIPWPATPEALVATLAPLGVRLPLEPSAHEHGVLVDALGDAIVTIDVNNERPDGNVAAVTGLLCMIINTAAGFAMRGVQFELDDDERFPRDILTRAVTDDRDAECSGHVASANDPKVCGRCGIHIDELRPDDDDAPAGNP